MTDKLSWVERVKHVARFHAAQLAENPKWTIVDTGKELKRSKGRISEDLLLARYMKTHPRVELFRTVQDALEYCRKIKRDQRMEV